MKLKRLLLMLLVVMATSMVVSSQEIGINQIKQMMERSADNLTTYEYSRSDESYIRYANASVQREFIANKTTSGEVDLINRSGSWNANLTDESTGNVLRWGGYLIDSSEYWNVSGNWTKFNVNDTARAIQSLNEIPDQVNLLKYSDMKLIGSETFQGEDYYKLMGSPMAMIHKGMLSLQLLATYLPSPFRVPQMLMNRSFNISNTSLMNNSDITITAWVSKDKFLLKRMDINSTLVITPNILNIQSPNYTITSTFNESTIYNNFGAPVKILIPSEAQRASSRFNGTDWRWAVFGSARP